MINYVVSAKDALFFEVHFKKYTHGLCFRALLHDGGVKALSPKFFRMRVYLIH